MPLSDRLRTMGVATLGLLVFLGWAAAAEDIWRESFEGAARKEPLARTWGDEPAKIAANATEPAVGPDGSSAAHLKLTFPRTLFPSIKQPVPNPQV